MLPSVIGMVALAASAHIGAPAHATGSLGLSVSNNVTGHYGLINENTAQNKSGKWGMMVIVATAAAHMLFKEAKATKA